MTPREPDELLFEINRSMLLKALAISLAVHAVLVFGTSFGLYRDWSAFGMHTPSTIKQMKQKAMREADEAERRAAAVKKAEEAKAAEAAATNAPPAAAAVPVQTAETAPAVETLATPVAPELAPLPPKAGFTLGEDLNLD